MDKLNRFISKHLGNIALVITFTILINEMAILGAYAGWKIRWIVVIICDLLLMCDWIYLFRSWMKFKHKETMKG